MGMLRCNGDLHDRSCRQPILAHQRARCRPVCVDSLHAEFGEVFHKVASETEIHTIPRGTEQEFLWCYCQFMH